MRVHKRVVHGPFTESECKECGKVFKNRERLAAHAFRHTEKQLQCDICKRMFLLKKDLKSHIIVTHCNKREHMCEECGMGFNSKYRLQTHMASGHARAAAKRPMNKCPKGGVMRNAKCSLCNRSYSRLNKLAIHYRNSHSEHNWTDLLAVTCDHCFKRFGTPDLLDAHKQAVHAHLQCSVCEQGFFSRKKLDEHARIHEKKERPHICNVSTTGSGCHKNPK